MSTREITKKKRTFSREWVPRDYPELALPPFALNVGIYKSAVVGSCNDDEFRTGPWGSAASLDFSIVEIYRVYGLTNSILGQSGSHCPVPRPLFLFRLLYMSVASLGKRTLADTFLARFIERITPAIDCIASEVSFSASTNESSYLFYKKMN